MTLPRSAITAALLGCLIAGNSTALHAQYGVDTSSMPGNSNCSDTYFAVNINDVTTRVQITPDAIPGGFNDCQFRIRGHFQANIVLCAPWLEPNWLKESLLRVATGKNGEQLRGLVQQIENEPDRLKRLGLIVGVADYDVMSYAPNPQGRDRDNEFSSPIIDQAGKAKLRMGQELTVIGGRCATRTYVDQVNAEGLRVLKAVAQAMTPGFQKPPTSGQGVQTGVNPGAAPQQLQLKPKP